jgi:4-amino-4-deoxy-L-arabinose transferase-like glycosyltransferase
VLEAPPRVSRSGRCLTRLRETLGTPVAAVAAVALAHGLLWSILIPPFQVPDETDHFAYSQYLAEAGRLPPTAGHSAYSSEELATFGAIGTTAIIGRPLAQPPRSSSLARQADGALRQGSNLSRSNGGGASSASTQPPLYYALATVPYELGSHGSLLTRLWLMRLLSVACFVATAVGSALLAAELLPSRAWAPLVAGLLVALQPVLAFTSVGVNPDALLFAVSTFALLVAARIVRQGLTPRRAVLLGALTGAGVVTKVTFAGLVPGLALALVIGLHHAARSESRHELVRLAGLSVLVAATLPLLYMVWTLLVGRGLFPSGGGVGILPADQQAPASLRTFISYAWQLYLPRLPFLQDQFGFWPPYAVWLNGLLGGRLGWLDYNVSSWIFPAGAALFCVSLALVVIAMMRRRRFWAYRRELLVFATCAVGLALEIAYAGYAYRRATGDLFEQSRYLFPLVGLYATGVVAACTAFGRRAAPALAACYIGIASLQVLAVAFATVARYYG